MKMRTFLSAVCLLALFSSCKKDKDDNSQTIPVATGAYILSEGLYGNNNTVLTYYDFATATPSTDYYQKANGSGLGDTGNDILLYGGKIYIVMNVSSYVQVADAHTAKALKNIAFTQTSGAARQPRFAAPYKDKVLVTSWDGTIAVIDTASLAIDKFISTGSVCEGIAVLGDRAYVANTGNYLTGYDSTLSVIDLISMTETKKITVGTNPGPVTADSTGNIFVGVTGDYGSIKPALVKVSSTSNTVTKSVALSVAKIRYHDGLLYATAYDSTNVRTVNTSDLSQAKANFVTDGTAIKQPYGVNIDIQSGDIYVMDAKDYTVSGEVFCFDKTGKKKFSFSVTPGVNPNTVVFIR